MVDHTSDVFGRNGDLYRDAAPELLAELKQAAKECSGFATLTDKGPLPARDLDYFNDRDPRTALFQRLQWLHLKAAGICYED